MANDQFQFPHQSSERPLQEALRIADSFQYSQERQPEAYRHIKDIEDRIHSYRRTALEIEQRREPGFVEAVFGIRRQKVTLEDLIEKESYIGGKLFGPNDRLWLSHKGSTPHAAQNNLGDWYHVREHYDSFGRKQGETVLHFETHPTHLVKLHNAQPIDPMLTELETLSRAIELYEERVREELYPLDQEIFDLMTEANGDDVVIPDTVEEMFGKEIVARVVAEHKAKKGISDSPHDEYGLAA